MTNERDEAIKARAYQLWMEGGCAHGHDEEHWHQAERELGGVVQTKDVTEMRRPDDDGVDGSAARDDDPTVLHRVPEPGGKPER